MILLFFFVIWFSSSPPPFFPSLCVVVVLYERTKAGGGYKKKEEASRIFVGENNKGKCIWQAGQNWSFFLHGVMYGQRGNREMKGGQQHGGGGGFRVRDERGGRRKRRQRRRQTADGGGGRGRNKGAIYLVASRGAGLSKDAKLFLSEISIHTNSPSLPNESIFPVCDCTYMKHTRIVKPAVLGESHTRREEEERAHIAFNKAVVARRPAFPSLPLFPPLPSCYGRKKQHIGN